MATNQTLLTLSGRLTASPRLSETPSGARYTKLRVASTSRVFDRAESQWRDGDTLFLDVTCWRRLAENAAATLERGDRVLIVGRLKQRSYEDGQGVRHTVFDVEAEAVGADLGRFPATLQRGDPPVADPGAAPAEPGHSEAPAAAA